jgi:hypothetical protein
MSRSSRFSSRLYGDLKKAKDLDEMVVSDENEHGFVGNQGIHYQTIKGINNNKSKIEETKARIENIDNELEILRERRSEINSDIKYNLKKPNNEKYIMDKNNELFYYQSRIKILNNELNQLLLLDRYFNNYEGNGGIKRKVNKRKVIPVKPIVRKAAKPTKRLTKPTKPTARKATKPVARKPTIVRRK